MSVDVIKYLKCRDILDIFVCLFFFFHFSHKTFYKRHMRRSDGLNEDIDRDAIWRMRQELKLSILLTNAYKEDSLKVETEIGMIWSQAMGHSECQ